MAAFLYTKYYLLPLLVLSPTISCLDIKYLLLKKPADIPLSFPHSLFAYKLNLKI